MDATQRRDYIESNSINPLWKVGYEMGVAYARSLPYTLDLDVVLGRALNAERILYPIPPQRGFVPGFRFGYFVYHTPLQRHKTTNRGGA